MATYVDFRGIPRCEECTTAAGQFKAAFPTRDDAIRARGNWKQAKKPLRPYHEETCGYWHLTSRAN